MWITNHWVDIVAIITGVSTLASIIVKLTPTIKDDNIVLPIIKFLSKVALNRDVDDKALRDKDTVIDEMEHLNG
jgi:hypothetical protein